MNCKNVVFSAHALGAMIGRGISAEDVIRVLDKGETIANYPTDKPYPSKLVLMIVNNRPVHVVVAQDATTADCIVITCYIPDPDLWDQEFRHKIK